MRPAVLLCCSTAPRTMPVSAAVFRSVFSSSSCALAMAINRVDIARSADSRLVADRMLWRTMAVTIVSMFFMR